MVSRILISIALLCSSVAMSQDENGLTFSQVLIVDITNEVIVPEGKVWKVVSMLDFDQDNGGCRVYVNDTQTWFRSTARDVGNIGDFVGPFWLPEGTSISNMYDASRMNVIEFNTN